MILDLTKATKVRHRLGMILLVPAIAWFSFSGFDISTKFKIAGIAVAAAFAEYWFERLRIVGNTKNPDP